VIRVRLDANGQAAAAENGGGKELHEQLAAIAGVDRVNDFGQLQELRIANGADPQQVLAALMRLGSVRHFELARPSLHDIFVRIARPEAQEASHVAA
jgi:ABC-2 type transport system ATP-binding protein